MSAGMSKDSASSTCRGGEGAGRAINFQQDPAARQVQHMRCALAAAHNHTLQQLYPAHSPALPCTPTGPRLPHPPGGSLTCLAWGSARGQRQRESRGSGQHPGSRLLGGVGRGRLRLSWQTGASRVGAACAGWDLVAGALQLAHLRAPSSRPGTTLPPSAPAAQPSPAQPMPSPGPRPPPYAR